MILRRVCGPRGSFFFFVFLTRFVFVCFFRPFMGRRPCHALRQEGGKLLALFRGSPPPSRLFPVLNKAAFSSLTSSHSHSAHHDSCKRASVRSRRCGLSTSPPPPPPPPPRTCRVYNITGDTVPYDQAWLWQQRLLHERMAWQREPETPAAATDRHDVLLLLEHPSIYTLGRGSSLDHLRFDPTKPSPSGDREVRRTERGGEVTWHGPGQIVGYPVLDLNFHKKDLHWYLRQLEEVSGRGSFPGWQQAYLVLLFVARQHASRVVAAVSRSAGLACLLLWTSR